MKLSSVFTTTAMMMFGIIGTNNIVSTLATRLGETLSQAQNGTTATTTTTTSAARKLFLCDGTDGNVGQGCSVFCPCNSGLNCQPGVHRCYNVPRQVDQPCSLGFDCANGLSCHPGVQKCYDHPRLENQPCSLGFDCASGLNCEAGTHVCRKPGRTGDPCHATRPCDTGFICQAGPTPMICIPEEVVDCISGTSWLTGSISTMKDQFLNEFIAGGEGVKLSHMCSILLNYLPMLGSYKSNYDSCVPDSLKGKLEFPGVLSFGVAGSGGALIGGGIEAGVALDLSSGELGCYVTQCAGLLVGGGGSVEFTIGIDFVTKIEDLGGPETMFAGEVDVGIGIGAGFTVSHSNPPTVGFSITPGTSVGLGGGTSIYHCESSATKRAWTASDLNPQQDQWLLQLANNAPKTVVIKSKSFNNFATGRPANDIWFASEVGPWEVFEMIPFTTGSTNVGIKSKSHGTYVMGDNENQVRLSTNLLSWEEWDITTNADDGSSSLRSVAFNKYVGASSSGGFALADAIGPWERFYIGEAYHLKDQWGNNYLQEQPDGTLGHNGNKGAWETWIVVTHPNDNNKISFLSHHGKFLGVQEDKSIYLAPHALSWEKFEKISNPSNDGSYYIKSNWNTYLGIQEDGTLFMADNALTWERWWFESALP